MVDNGPEVKIIGPFGTLHWTNGRAGFNASGETFVIFFVLPVRLDRPMGFGRFNLIDLPCKTRTSYI
jgi:hypothetical protein